LTDSEMVIDWFFTCSVQLIVSGNAVLRRSDLQLMPFAISALQYDSVLEPSRLNWICYDHCFIWTSIWEPICDIHEHCSSEHCLSEHCWSFCV